MGGGGGGERGEEREKKDKEKKIQKETNGNKSSTIWINFYLHMYEGGGVGEHDPCPLARV